MPDVTRRDYYQRRKAQMVAERESFLPHYRELSNFNAPRRGRFSLSDMNKGTKKHKNIINSKGMDALNTATSGLFAGVMSPTRPWFDLVSPDPDIMQFLPVKVWYRQVAMLMRSIFNNSNLYTAAPVMIGELLNFATGCMTHEDDLVNLSRFHTHTVGSYLLGQDDKFVTNTFCREFQMTAEQMALKFGVANLSQSVANAVKTNRLSSWHTVVHFIEPNDDFRPSNPFSKFKRFSSVMYEPENTDKNMFLSQNGFDEFPVYTPRWKRTGEDIYGTDCPGMVTLGDIKQLQIMERRKAQAIDKMVNPALSGPPSLRNVPINSLPGGMNIYDGGGNVQKLESIYNINLPIDHLIKDMDRVERRIDKSWFVDLFLAITNMEGIQPRNQLELSERNSERLLQLGPVLENMQGEFLDLLISRQFNQMVRADDLLPPAPREIQGTRIQVEYISSLAQAQRAVDTRSIDRLSQYTAGLVQAGLSDGKPFNSDEAIRKYGELVGTPPTLIVPQDEVKAAREQEAKTLAAKENLEAAEQAARVVRDTGQVDLGGDNPISAAVDNINQQ